MTPEKPTTIDEYLAGFPAEVQEKMQEVRAAIKEMVPEAEEKISYAIPAFYYQGSYLIYFAGYKKHISLYPVPTEDPEFENDFAAYKTSGKGTVQFPLDKPLPFPLITRIVQFMAKRNEEKNATKKAKKS